jgi:hypothetical protein
MKEALEIVVDALRRLRQSPTRLERAMRPERIALGFDASLYMPRLNEVCIHGSARF